MDEDDEEDEERDEEEEEEEEEWEEEWEKEEEELSTSGVSTLSAVQITECTRIWRATRENRTGEIFFIPTEKDFA